MKRTLLMAAAALIGAGQIAAAQTALRMVSGRVFDDTTGCPLRDAQVAVVGAATHAATDLHGRYHLASPPDAMFSLRVTLDGYLPRRADSLTVSDSSARVDFSLKRAAPPSAKAKYPAAKCDLEPGG